MPKAISVYVTVPIIKDKNRGVHDTIVRGRYALLFQYNRCYTIQRNGDILTNYVTPAWI